MKYLICDKESSNPIDVLEFSDEEKRKYEKLNPDVFLQSEEVMTDFLEFYESNEDNEDYDEFLDSE